jgi:uncharacterized glyoxalase superfamily protein PhnB
MADERDDAALAAIAAKLEGYPDPRFRADLRRRLERSVRMTTRLETAAVTPYVMVQDIEPAIAFAKQVFGAREAHRSVGSAGGIHCRLHIGDSVVFFGGAVPGEPVKPRLLGLHVYVEDADAVYRRALEAGGVSLGPVADRPYGERAGFVRDPAGNHWYIATHTGPTYFAREPGTVTPHLYVRRTPERGAPEFIAFLQAAFGADVELRHDTPDGRVAHAVVRIRGAAVEIGEGDEPQADAPSALVVSLEDLDAAYEQAMAAGARSLFPPAKQAFGGRMAGVADAWGNEWFLGSTDPASGS